MIDEAIAANPKSAELLQVKGDMLWSRRDANGAVQLFGKALEIDPDYQLARLSRANVNVARGEFAAADQDLDPILQASPENFMAKYLRGLEYVKRQNYTAADQIFHTIAGTFTAFPYGYYVQGATKFALGQFGPAESILRDYLKHFPTDPNATRLIAQAALQQHGAPRAIDYLKPLADKSPPDAATLNLLGNAYMADGKPEAALQQFEKAAALDPENATIKTQIGVAEINSGQVGQGLAKLEEVFSGATGAVVAGPTLVLAELRAGHVDKAAEVVKSLIERDPANLALSNSAGRGPRRATGLCRRGNGVSRCAVAQSGFFGGHSRLGPALCDDRAHRRCQANLQRCSCEEPGGYDGRSRSRRPRHRREEMAGSD